MTWMFLQQSCQITHSTMTFATTVSYFNSLQINLLKLTQNFETHEYFMLMILKPSFDNNLQYSFWSHFDMDNSSSKAILFWEMDWSDPVVICISFGCDKIYILWPCCVTLFYYIGDNDEGSALVINSNHNNLKSVTPSIFDGMLNSLFVRYLVIPRCIMFCRWLINGFWWWGVVPNSPVW